MREIVLDTETTGFDPAEGHRMVEVACVELMNLMPTGRELHLYFNPDRDMPAEAFAVHGLTEEFLKTHPSFTEKAAEFLDFMEDSPFVAHNADFDLRFLNAELIRAGRPRLSCQVHDTLAIARRKFPGAPASLDALCRRFGVDLSGREKHGALIDTRLLAKVYLELRGGVQPGLSLVSEAALASGGGLSVERKARPARPHAPSEAELAAHEAMMKKVKEPIWLQ